MTDYLAVAFLPYGTSAWGVDKSKEKAIEIARKEARALFKSLGMTPKRGAELSVHIFDVTDFKRLHWEYNGVQGERADGTIVDAPYLEGLKVRLTKRYQEATKP